MSDPATPSVPPTPPVDAATAPAAAMSEPPKKRPGLIRWKLLIVLVVLVAAIVLVVPLALDPYIAGKLAGALKDRGLALAPGATLHVSLLGGRIHGENLKLFAMDGDKVTTQEAAAATRLDGDIALMDSWREWDVILDEVVIEGMSGSLRRRADGTPPIGAPDDKSGTDWSKVDWAKWYQKAMDQYKQYADKKKQEQEEQKKKREEEEKKPPDQRQKVPDHPYEADPDWPKATKYKPLRRDGRTSSRVLIRHLSISGGNVGLPDESPFDITSFSLEGHDVALDQDLGEKMTLAGKIETKGAGPVTLDLDRTQDNGGLGSFALSAAKVPLAALNDPRIAGPEYAQYGATGDASVSLKNAWTGWDLSGGLDSVITGLNLKPTAEAGAQAQQVATYVNQLKGQPIAWPVKLGGTLYSPTITDSGVKQVLSGSALDAAKNLVGDKAQQEATKVIDQQGAKNPEVKSAVDKAKSLFPKK